MKLTASIILAAAALVMAADAGAQGLAVSRTTQPAGPSNAPAAPNATIRVRNLGANLSSFLVGNGPAAGLAAASVQFKLATILNSSNAPHLKIPLTDAIEKAEALYEVRNSEEGARRKLEILATVINALGELYEVEMDIQGGNMKLARLK